MKVPPPGGAVQEDDNEVNDGKNDRKTENFEDVCVHT